MPEMPIGTVTFVFTDIVGSTRLWEKFPTEMATAVREHDALLHQIFASKSGYVFKTVGDSFCVAFEQASAAIEAAVEVQLKLEQVICGEHGPLRVRVGLHTGPAEVRDQDYFGGTLNRVARIEAAAHGGQILTSHLTVDLLADDPLINIDFRDLGEHHLRSLERPEHLFQVVGRGLGIDFPPPRSMEVLPNNLPNQTTSFIGREEEMEQVAKALTSSSRMVTLIGTGGTGKTRLAIEAGASLIGAFPDGVWLAELALLSDASKLLPAVASALRVREEPGTTLRDTLMSSLQNRKLLLILDNCEHLSGAVASLAVEILRNCPQTKMLATSRHALGIAGESTLPIPPLGIIDLRREPLRGPDLAERLSQYDAVRLFIERACAVNPSFEVTNDNAPAVAEICSRLDGIPLAIELAAARTRLLAVSQLAARLNDRFRIIRGGGADRLPHQQTLEALIEWSYELLSEPEKILFRRLGIFRGGRTLEAVEAIGCCGGLDSEDILDVLQQLVEKSLVGTEGRADARYTMLESVWHYARRKLEEVGESEEVGQIHANHFLAWATEAAPHFEGQDQARWLDRFDADSYNLDTAFNFLLSHGSIAEAARLLVALSRPIEVRGRLSEWAEHIESIIGQIENLPVSLRAEILATTGRLAWAMDRYEEGRKAFEKAIPAAREVGNDRLADLVQGFLGFFDRGEGLLDAAEKRFNAGLEAAAHSGDLRLRAIGLSGLGRVSLDRGQLEQARKYSEEALKIYRGLGDHWIIGLILWNVANTALELRETRRAEKALCEWSEIAKSLGNKWSIPYILVHFARVALQLEAPRSAARFLGGAEAVREDFGTRLTRPEEKENARAIEETRNSLEEDVFAALWQEGRDTEPEKLINQARKGICPRD